MPVRALISDHGICPRCNLLERLPLSLLIWVLGLFLAAALLFALFVILTRRGRAVFHTSLFVSETLNSPVKPQSWFTGDSMREEVHYQTAEGTAVADVYRLTDGRPRAAAMISLGANERGRDDSDVISLGHALARAGFVVMFHWTSALGLDASMDPAEPERLVMAFQYLEGRDYVDGDRVGLAGFCVGASFALVAASDSRISDRVYFVNAFGPFFDAKCLILQIASRAILYEGEPTAWEPDSLTLRVVSNALIGTLHDPDDVDTLTRHFLNDHPATQHELAALSPSGKTVAALLDGVEPREAERLYPTLPDRFREDLARVSPSNHVEGLRARLLVMHDRYDMAVPAAESRRLVKKMRERLDVRYTEFVSFQHVRPGAGGLLTRLGQALQLYRHMYHIFRMAH